VCDERNLAHTWTKSFALMCCGVLCACVLCPHPAPSHTITHTTPTPTAPTPTHVCLRMPPNAHTLLCSVQTCPATMTVTSSSSPPAPRYHPPPTMHTCVMHCAEVVVGVGMQGDQCGFRHSEAAKANKTMCVFWAKGQCTAPQCPYRHFNDSKHAKARTPANPATPCYWETQPSGVFLFDLFN
jgi:hypothetical protein